MTPQQTDAIAAAGRAKAIAASKRIVLAKHTQAICVPVHNGTWSILTGPGSVLTSGWLTERGAWAAAVVAVEKAGRP